MTAKLEKRILKEGVMNFFFKKEELRSLSNFWECIVEYRDEDEMRDYDSGEACFHGEKFTQLGKLCQDENRKEQLLEYGRKFLRGCEMNAAMVKKMGRKLILDKSELDLWNILSVDVQKQICKFKYENYDEVRDDLLKSKGKLLVHPAMRCNEEKVKSKFWEGKAIVVNGNIEIIGKNVLGNLWMEIRDNYTLEWNL
jgi:predicted NAD-dependent protein-ADP-ribosyltransferase YbiA (DUF1768 family)